MEVLSSFKNTFAILGLVGLELYLHHKQWQGFSIDMCCQVVHEISAVFHVFFHWTSHGFPVSVSTSPGEASRDCCGQGVRNRGSAIHNWIIGGWQVDLLPAYSSYQLMATPCCTILIGYILGSYRFLGL